MWPLKCLYRQSRLALRLHLPGLDADQELINRVCCPIESISL